MKLLSISPSFHDLNISFFDGHKTHYLKTERILQIKHHGDTTLLNKSINSITNKLDFSYTIDIVEKFLKIDMSDIDAICVDTSYAHTNNIDYDIRNDKLYHKYDDKIYIVDHHYLHALSLRALSDVDYDVEIVIDGRGGDYAWSVFKNNQKIDSAIVHDSGSIGHGISLLGTQMNMTGHILDLAGKIMGLQSYGNIDEELMKTLYDYDINSVGAIAYLNRHLGVKYGMFDISKVHNKLNAIHTIHERAGELVIELFAKHANINDNVSYSGGVAQNVIWNTKLKSKYKNLNILPHISDEGLSLGGLEFLREQFNLPKFDFSEFPFMQHDEAPDEISDKTIDEVAQLLADGKVVAWYQGHGEIGPRALGNRSVLMDPRIENGRDIVNSIKNREYYRPFGASVLVEYAKEYFDLDYENPYMLYVGVTQKDNLKAITHVDGTCRAQTVKSGSFRKLLERFHAKTGCPVLLNTSLNISGKPIAAHIKDAMYEFENSKIDVLVVGDTVYNKSFLSYNK